MRGHRCAEEVLGKCSFFHAEKEHYKDHIMPEGRLTCREYITWIYLLGNAAHGKREVSVVPDDKDMFS